MLLPRGSNFLQMKVGYTYKNIPIISKNKNSVINKQEVKEIVTRNGRDRGGRSGPVRWLFGWGSQPRRAKDARDRVCRHHHRLRPPASLSGPVPSPTPTIPPLLSGPSNPIPPNPLLLLLVPLPRPRLDPEGISGRPPSLQFRAQLPSLGPFWNRPPSRRLSRPQRSNSVGFLLPSRSPSGGARPETGAEGVDATRRWIAEPSGVTRATARTRRLPPRPRRRRRRCTGRPRRRWGAPRTTSASARRCCPGAPRAARPARPTRAPSGGCSGRTPTGRSSPRSWNSSLVIQVTRMMIIWILAYAQSCKYRRAESPVHLAQVESTSV
ncbi:hypothetical protein VPH35_080060 [Triticum aestivum]